MKKLLSILLAVLMFFTSVPADVFAAAGMDGQVPAENYLINTNEYMTRLHTNINGEAEFELGFKVRFDGEDQDRFTAAMGENLLANGQIKINDGQARTFADAGMEFATAKSKSSFLTTNKEFIKEFYELDTFNVTVITPEGYEITAESAIRNNMDASEREAFKNSLTQGVDKTDLNAKIAELKAILEDGKTYPEEAKEAARLALSTAEVVAAKEDASQDEVNEELAKVQAAIEGMVEEKPAEGNQYTIDEGYTFVRNYYGTMVLRIDFKEFTSGSDPAKQAYLDNATISINDVDFGSMKELGFTATNYFGFELADLSRIKSVINADELHIVMTENGKTTSFVMKNELSKDDRASISGVYPEETGTVDIVMNHETKDQPSMCDPLFGAKADIVVKGDQATLKVYVANPVPAFPEQGADGTVKNVKLTYAGQEYVAESDITTKPMMAAKVTNALFGLTQGTEIPAQVLTFTVPKEALSETSLKIDAFVNVVMNTDVVFRMMLSNLVLGGEQQTNKTELNAKIEELNAILADGKTYTEESLEAARLALSTAEAVAAKEDASQDEVDAEVTKLQAAIDGMTEVQPEVDNQYTIDSMYTFLKNQYGSMVLRIDFVEFLSGSDPAKQAYLDNATISINGVDFGSMKTLGFTITNYYGFELADLSKIKSVIGADELNIVLTENGKTTSFTVKNELSQEERDSIAGTEPQPENPDVKESTIGSSKAELVKSDDTSQPSMSGTTMKHEAEMIVNEDGSITMILHFEPAVIMGILAYATDLDLNDGTTEFVMKEDNSAVCVAELPAFEGNEHIFQGHIYSSVMDADVALKVEKPLIFTSLKDALAEEVTKVEALLKTNAYYENTKAPVEAALEAAKAPADTKTAYTDLVKAVAGLRKVALDPFTGDTVFHVGVVDTSIIGSKAIEKYAKVEIKDDKKIFTVHYNSYLDWDGEIYVENITVFDTEGKEIPSNYTLDDKRNGVLTFVMPYVPSSGLFDVKLALGNGKGNLDSEIQMDYSTIHKGPFRELLIDAIETYGKYTADDWNTRIDLSEKKDDFTEASWNAFAATLQKAKDDLTSPSLTQDQIEEDIKALKEARLNLVYKIKAGNGNTANTGIGGLNNPPAPYYSDTEKEYPEYVGWGGSKIVFGNDGAVYRVLDTGKQEGKDTGRILLMAETLRVKQPYTSDPENTSVRWNDSMMRAYMNGEFYDNAFSEVEKSAILRSQIDTFDYTDGFMGPPAKLPDTKVTTEDYIFAPDMQMMSSEKYGYGSKDSRIVATEYSLREVFEDLFGEYVTLGVSPKGRIAGTFGLASARMEAPVCMNLDSSKVLMTVDAKTGLPQGITSAEAIDTNLWKLVLRDDSMQLDDTYEAAFDGNKVRVDMKGKTGSFLAVVVEGNDFATGKVKAYGMVDPNGFEVPKFDKNTEKLYLLAVKDEEGKTAYASAPAEIVEEKEEVVKTGWVKENGKWYYYDENGAMKTGWFLENGKWFYFSTAEADLGQMASGGFKAVGRTWYYFYDTGRMATGWLQEDGHWYYLQPSGAMAKGWQKLGTSWFYFNGSGHMQTGWFSVGRNWFYAYDSGRMATGWLQQGGHWYYLASNGVMEKGWQKHGRTWYYFNGSGHMATGTRVIDGKTYHFSESGALL